MTAKLEDLMHEEKVYELYGHLLAARELRTARSTGEIEWFDLRKGPHYTAAGVMAYLERRKVQPCHDGTQAPADDSSSGSGKSASSGLRKKRGPTSSSIAGMTPELEEFAAEQLARPT